MSDVEYAIQIYCAVFGQDGDVGDIYFRGVFDALASLSDRYQLALRCRFRENKSYAQVGKNLNVSGACARQIVLNVLHKLRKKKQKMSVSSIMEKCDILQKRLEEQEFDYRKLYNQLSKLFRGESIDERLRENLERQQIKIKDLGLSGYITNALARANIVDCEALLFVDYDELKKIRSIGRGSLCTITNKMSEYGFVEWADKINKAIQRKRRDFSD